MRKQRNPNVPAFRKPPTHIYPRAFPRPPAQQRSTSSQTEPMISARKQITNFSRCIWWLKQNDDNIKRDYEKALCFINTCHNYFNANIRKKKSRKTELFEFPIITGYFHLLPYLMKEPKNQEQTVSKSVKRKEKFGIAVRKTAKQTIDDPIPGNNVIVLSSILIPLYFL